MVGTMIIGRVIALLRFTAVKSLRMIVRIAFQSRGGWVSARPAAGGFGDDAAAVGSGAPAPAAPGSMSALIAWPPGRRRPTRWD
jgi:hypothetical protein